MSSSKGLDQLCAAACDTAMGSPLPNGNPGEIKVREIEAYASVADLIHAAIVANSGAASLKEIYEVCEEHGRIAYRRADGSRLITSNDHWKSQVRHALYTGGRFERVPSNGEYWQLTPASRGSSAELVKVLVRADDDYLHIRATLELTPSGARTSVPNPTANIGAATARTSGGHETRQATGTSRQRRKRTSNSPTSPAAATAAAAAAEAGSIEAMCDSIDPAAAGAVAGTAGALRAPPSLRQSMRLADSNAPDNHSTQDEDLDEVRELPRSRAKRTSKKPTWKVANASEDDEEAFAAVPAPVVAGGRKGAAWAQPYHYNNQILKHEYEDQYFTHRQHNNQHAGGSGGAQTHHVHLASKDSADPSTLRWGSTCLRSTYIISATAGESSGLSAGRTPLLPGRRTERLLGGSGGGGNGGGRLRDTSAEADSAPMKKWRQTHGRPPSSGGAHHGTDAGPPLKRQAVAGAGGFHTNNTSRGGLVPTPQAHAEGPGGVAQMTPPFISQWAEAMQQHLEEAAAVAQQQKQTTAEAGTSAAAVAAAAAAGWPSFGASAGSPTAVATIPGFPSGFPTMAMLPAMLPGLLAAAAPYFSSQQAQQQMQQQMQAIMLNPGAAAAAAAAAAAVANVPGAEEK